MKKVRVAVIGAGVSGLTLADRLSEWTEFEVSVFEKSRGVGGRTATKRIEDVAFDTGFQIVPNGQEMSSQFQKEVWGDKIVPVPTSNAYCKSLAQKNQIELNCQISKLERVQKKWVLSDSKKSFEPFDFVVLTTPPAQVLLLLSEDILFFEKIKSAKMSACFALMVCCMQKLKLEWSFLEPEKYLLKWISHQSSMPQRNFNKSVFVAHADSSWSDENIDLDIERVHSLLVEDFLKITSIDKVLIHFSKVHRWRYALTKKAVGEDFLVDAQKNIAVCGDWLLGDTIHDAIQSAEKLADFLKMSPQR